MASLVSLVGKLNFLLNKSAIGIDIGGTTTKFGIVNADGKILQQDRISSTKYEDIKEFIDELATKLLPLIQQHGGNNNFIGIGVGAPNGNYYTGTIEYAPNLNWKGIVPIASLFIVSKNNNYKKLMTS